MHLRKDNIEKLQRKVKLLLQASSDEQSQNYSKNNQDSEAQTVRKCIQLINENKQLKKELQKQKNQNQRLFEQIKKQKERFSQIQRKLTQQITHYRSNERNKLQCQTTLRNTKVQVQLQVVKKRMKDMEKILINERKKCKKLAMFIKQQLPTLQQSMAVLTGKMDTKLQTFYLKDYNL